MLNEVKHLAGREQETRPDVSLRLAGHPHYQLCIFYHSFRSVSRRFTQIVPQIAQIFVW